MGKHWLLILTFIGNVLLMGVSFAHNIELKGELTQGSLIRAKVPAGSQVWLNEKAIKVAKNGDFVFGFGRDAELTHTLKWITPDSETFEKKLTLTKRQYDIQKIEGVASKYVSPPNKVMARIAKDNKQIAAARATDTDLTHVFDDFSWPAEGRISGVYGSQRVFNGVPKRPHFGLDVAGPTGTPVYAPVDGVVTLAVPDMYYSGGTMIIDHGFGVSSTFIHLSKLHVTPGTKVKKGQLVADIGATGRVTGPHLDWRINWFKERLDPELLVPKR